MTDAARASQVSRRRTRIATLLRTYGVVLALVALVVAVALATRAS